MEPPDLEEQIRAEYEAGATYRELMKKYRKSPSSLKKITSGEGSGGEKVKVVTSIELAALLPHRIKKMDHVKWLNELLLMPPEDVESWRDYIRNLIIVLVLFGIVPIREDLARMLGGKLDFAVMRWRLPHKLSLGRD